MRNKRILRHIRVSRSLLLTMLSVGVFALVSLAVGPADIRSQLFGSVLLAQSGDTPTPTPGQAGAGAERCELAVLPNARCDEKKFYTNWYRNQSFTLPENIERDQDFYIVYYDKNGRKKTTPSGTFVSHDGLGKSIIPGQSYVAPITSTFTRGTTAITQRYPSGGYYNAKVTLNNASKTTCKVETLIVDRCPLPPINAFKRVFITKNTYTGTLDEISKRSFDSNEPTRGLAAVDNVCQDEAATAQLGGVWKAWLSDRDTDAVSRLSLPRKSFYTTRGKEVELSGKDFTSGSLLAYIQYDQFGGLASVNSAWTGTKSSGSNDGKNDCNKWGQLSENNPKGTYGIIQATKKNEWTSKGTTACTIKRHFYCFEQ